MTTIRNFLSACFTICLTFYPLADTFAQDFEIRLIANSKTLSQAIAINSSLEVIGTREITEGPITSFKGFFRKAEVDETFAVPNSYTNLEPCALSENGLVTGYVSRTSGTDKSMLGFVWDSRSKEVVLLQPLETDSVCQAQDISADGKIVSGYSTGSNPPRTRPCVWELANESAKLVPRELSSIIPNSPFLQAGRVIISPDGKRVAACISEEQLSPISFNSSLFVWEHAKNGDWNRSKVSDEQPKLKDMNNGGTMVGSVKSEGYFRACIVDLTGELKLIDLLAGDESNEANGVTESGIVVGFSDDPMGGIGGPTAFVFTDGVVSPLELPKNTIHSAALGITDSGAICGYLTQDTEEEGAAYGFIRIPKRIGLQDQPKVQSKVQAK